MEKIDESKPTGMTCPECGPAVPLVVRTNQGNGSQFLGCSNYPECHYSRSIPEEWRLREAGQLGLFDSL